MWRAAWISVAVGHHELDGLVVGDRLAEGARSLA
jgi:hypothetical protein